MFDTTKLIPNLTRGTDRTGVLLISSDVPFRAVAAELLRHRGFTVTSEERMTGVPRLAARASAEVVVLDAEASPESVAAEAVAITKLCHPIGVVVLCDNPGTTVCGVRALPKWGSIDALHQAIDDASASSARIF